MNKKTEEYRAQLRQLKEWKEFLMHHSGLPGPRGNLQLAEAVALEGDPDLFLTYAAMTADEAPVNTPAEFLTFCGVLGLGYLITSGDHHTLLLHLRMAASDSRWRIREATAMGLQEIGKKDMHFMLQIAEEWSTGNLLEKRAAIAGICEPALLKDSVHALPVFHILNNVTVDLKKVTKRKTDNFRALKKALAYGWSVAVAAYPETGKPIMENWISSGDPDIRWIMRENLKKKRLERMDKEWVQEQLTKMEPAVT